MFVWHIVAKVTNKMPVVYYRRETTLYCSGLADSGGLVLEVPNTLQGTVVKALKDVQR